jgi:hypothetical protein
MFSTLAAPLQSNAVTGFLIPILIVIDYRYRKL